ncbi:MAG TPA: hypothetical protein VGC32_13570 [Solirubrobacterales bacterium]
MGGPASSRTRSGAGEAILANAACDRRRPTAGELPEDQEDAVIEVRLRA